jgi:hypothetical protein
MFKLNRIVLAAAMLAMTASASKADVLPPGGLGGAAIGVTSDTGNLLTATSLNGLFVLGGGVDSLAGVEGSQTTTLDTSSFGTFTLTGSNGSDTFTFTGGTLVAQTSGTTAEGARYRNFTLNGIATLGGDSNTATLIIGFVQAVNDAVNGPISGTLSLVTPALVPEPSSVALAGIGLAAAGLFGLRKRLAK